MEFSVEDITKISDAKLINFSQISPSFSICTDSRTISEKDVYLPLIGEKFDGHAFINSCVEKGVKAYFLDKNHNVDDYKKTDFVFQVENTLETYLKLASFWRSKLNPFTIAITGSSGKTTVKEMLSSVLSQYAKTHKSQLNHNNEIGLCQTLLSLQTDDKFLVVEMGMRGLGEIDLLAKYAKPDIAIINNIGTAHIGRLGSVENIAKAKCEITNYLKKDGLLITFENDFVKKYSKTKNIIFCAPFNLIFMDEDKAVFDYKGERFELCVSGEYNILNALTVIEASKACGLSYDEISKGIKKYAPIEKRGSKSVLKNGAILINDCYNANPDSMKASVKTFLSACKSSKKVLVLGDMGELGEHEEYYHREIGTLIKKFDADVLITVGTLAKLIAQEAQVKCSKSFEDDETDKTVLYLKDIMQNGCAALFKASRSMRLEEIIKKLLEE